MGTLMLFPAMDWVMRTAAQGLGKVSEGMIHNGSQCRRRHSAAGRITTRSAKNFTSRIEREAGSIGLIQFSKDKDSDCA